MELLYFIWSQFKIPIIGITVLVLLAWLRVFVRPVRRVPPQDVDGHEDI
ncbi:MAG: hypothetical protein ACOY4Q_14820 [Bacillota bacterium]